MNETLLNSWLSIQEGIKGIRNALILEFEEGTKKPWYVGRIYSDYSTYTMVCSYIPFNLLFIVLCGINFYWMKWRLKPTWIDKKIKSRTQLTLQLMELVEHYKFIGFCNTVEQNKLMDDIIKLAKPLGYQIWRE